MYIPSDIYTIYVYIYIVKLLFFLLFKNIYFILYCKHLFHLLINIYYIYSIKDIIKPVSVKNF